MATTLRTLFVLGTLLLAGTSTLQAQQIGEPGRRYDDERNLIESALHTVVMVLQEATFQNTGDSISERLRQMTAQLNTARQPFRLAASTPAAEPVAEEDLRRLEAMLRDLYDQLRSIREELSAEQQVELAERLAPVERGLRDAVATVHALVEDDDHRAEVRRDQDGWLRPGRYEGGRYEPLPGRRDEATADAGDWSSDERGVFDDARAGIREGIEGAREGIREGLGWWRDDERERDEDRDWKPRDRRAFGYRTYSVTLNDFLRDWPYTETALYRPIPAVRYNRVEGLVLGIGMPPLRWDDYDRNHVYGQIGYAFALDRWRYEVGMETRIGGGYRSDYNLKLGGNYHRNTATDDLWKSSWLENSLAAFLFKNDFFDYYEVQGWTLYAVQQLTPYAQFSAGYRSDDYSSLDRNTNWALFGGDDFRDNPAIDDGEMRSFVFAFEGGRIGDMDYLPRGLAFRTEAEFGKGLGGDFSFNRFLGDVRAYVPTSYHSTLSLRLRGGYLDGDNAPIQKHFTIGGLGSVRGYPQNLFFGTRTLLGNVEFAFDDVSLFDEILDDVQFFGFADAGWVNELGRNAFHTDDLFTSVGLGIGLDDRYLRLELAWPLRDVGFGHEPTLWLRLNPTF